MIDAKKRRSRRWLRWLLLLALIGVAVLAKGYWNATRDPVIRLASVAVANWPAGQPPLRLLLLSDIHVAGPDMPPARLEHIVAGLNRLRPDLVLIAGDLVSEKRAATHVYTAAQVVAPLGGLRAPLGVVVAPGNHDHWFDPAALRRALERQKIRVLQNEAVKLGPLVIGGIDDDYSGHADAAATLAAILAGHTHCGQIRFPFVGAISYVSRYGDRFACGDMRDRGQRIFVGAGLGTSVLPLRFGTPPDAWLITLGPKADSE